MSIYIQNTQTLQTNTWSLQDSLDALQIEIEEIDEEDSLVVGEGEGAEVYVCVWPCEEKENRVSVSIGDRVEVKYDCDEWIYGRLCDGREGFIPKSFLRRDSSDIELQLTDEPLPPTHNPPPLPHAPILTISEVSERIVFPQKVGSAPSGLGEVIPIKHRHPELSLDLNHISNAKAKSSSSTISVRESEKEQSQRSNKEKRMSFVRTFSLQTSFNKMATPLTSLTAASPGRGDNSPATPGRKKKKTKERKLVIFG
jgi:hypothetical protein